MDLHPVTPEHPAATFPTQRTGGLASALGPAFFDPAPLAGDGTPGVAEYAVEELAAALGLSHLAGLALVAEAVELRHRLPRLWTLVQDGWPAGVEGPPGRQGHHQLSRDAVAFVDRHLAVTARSNRLPALNPVLHEARLRCDPDQAAAVEQNALDHRGVWLDHRESTATTLVTARMDTLDALDLDGSITDLAGLLGRLGDHRTLDVRRASALGMLAHPQRALDLAAGTDPGTDPEPGAGLNGSRGTLYLHVTLADLATTTGGSGRVERLGTASLGLLRDWLQRLSGVSIRPVLDPARTDTVDAHDPPAWMRELVILRDRHCVFPGCTVDARACDLDHLQRYVPLDRGRSTRPDLAAEPRVPVSTTPPGQDLRRLALPPPPRRRADQPGPTYEWTSPHLRTYRVTSTPLGLRRATTLVEVPEPPRGEGLETTRTHAPWPPPSAGAEVSRRLRQRSGAPQSTSFGSSAHLHPRVLTVDRDRPVPPEPSGPGTPVGLAPTTTASKVEGPVPFVSVPPAPRPGRPAGAGSRRCATRSSAPGPA